jgi:hypothetical protein
MNKFFVIADPVTRKMSTVAASVDNSAELVKQTRAELRAILSGNVQFHTDKFVKPTEVVSEPGEVLQYDATAEVVQLCLRPSLSWKEAVVAATTANITLSAPQTIIDGVTLVTGNRILVKNQTAPAENGIYIVQASGAPVRALDISNAIEFSSATLLVKDGTVNAGTWWTQTATVATVGTDPVSFINISAYRF